MIEDISFSNEGYGYIIDENGVTIAHKNRDIVREKMNTIDDAVNDPSLNSLPILKEEVKAKPMQALTFQRSEKNDGIFEN